MIIDGFQIQSLLAVFLPAVVDLITKNVTDSKKRYLIAVLISVITGVLLNINLFFPFDPTQLLANLGVVIVAAQASYKLYWEDSKVRANADLKPE